MNKEELFKIVLTVYVLVVLTLALFGVIKI